ncbi:MAG: DNA repair protein RecN [Paludibacteraceae bacterium]|nr:DNA repair protein RecN [Paludibacteraceae bacterium]
MLQSLYIKNFVLIKELDLNFGRGFSVITGETGAGKSILLGALSLVLGARSETKYISEGHDKCIIEATFEIGPYQLQSFFEENDLDYSDTCILRRELHRSGKTRQFLNDSPVSASVLKTLSSLFIDIHSQHENLLIKDSKFQLQVVDTFAQNQALLAKYQDVFGQYKQTTQQLEESMALSEKAQSESDYLQYQFDQLEKAHLKASELQELEAENEVLEHAHEIKSTLYQVESLLQNERGVVSLLKEAESKLASIASYADEYNQWTNRIAEAYIDLKDLASDINHAAERIEANPAQLQANQERLDTLYTLLQKHKVNQVEELIELRDKLQEQLQQWGNNDEKIAALRKQQTLLLQEVEKQAALLHEQRVEAANRISPLLEGLLHDLGMQQATVQVQVQGNQPLSQSGKDSIEFLYAPTKNSSLQAAGKIASGGEISRFMLCIKYLMADCSNLPTLIFDEIDTGISGETASLMGSMLQKMSNHAQIICITHLPQIAAMGKEHYFVRKTDTETTQTEVTQLTEDERITAIARMLSGTNISDAAIQNAQDLLLGNS